MGQYTDSWIEVEKSLGNVRPVLKGTAEEQRVQFTGLGLLLASQKQPASDSVATRDGNVDGVAYRVYKPSAAKQLAIGLYYHCGGFIMGNLDSDDDFCRTIAQSAGVIIVSVDYRLSPEHKAPAHLQDALKLFDWCYRHSLQLGGDASKMFTIGASAGGTLAFAVARQIVMGQCNLPADAIKGVVALCPGTVHPDNIPANYRAVYKAYEENKDNVPVLEKSTMMVYYQCAGLQPDDKDYFALLDSKSHGLLPSTYIATCDMDPLRDDGKVMERALVAANGRVKSRHYEGLPHCFWIFPSLPENSTFIKDTADGVRWVLDH